MISSTEQTFSFHKLVELQSILYRWNNELKFSTANHIRVRIDMSTKEHLAYLECTDESKFNGIYYRKDDLTHLRDSVKELFNITLSSVDLSEEIFTPESDQVESKSE